MAKSRKIHRKRLSRELSIVQQGLEFVRISARISNKKNVGTNGKNKTSRTANLLSKSPRKSSEDSSTPKPTKTKPIFKKPQRKGSAEIRKKPTPATTPVIKTSSKAVVPSVTVPSIPAPTPVVRTGSRASNVGKVAQLGKSKSKDVQIPSFGFIDVCFCVDSTGSMTSQLAQVQQVIKAIISNIESKVRTQGLQLRFAIVSYRDHPPQDSSYVTKYQDFTDQYEATQYLKTLVAAGGGDQPQAAHDGLLVAAQKLRWAQIAGTPVLRYIFHIADAPPHGSQFLNPQSQKGCLCGLQTDDIIREINKKNIHYRLIKVRNNPKVDEMDRIFRTKIGDFDSTDISHARELNVKVSDMIIHEVLPDYA